MTPSEAASVLDLYSYPIEIGLIMAKQKDGVYGQVEKGDIISSPLEKLRGYECGVWVKIRDYGTGIGEADIEQIADVGSSYEQRKDEIQRMPKWLQPTGTFGIGLQSAFWWQTS